MFLARDNMDRTEAVSTESVSGLLVSLVDVVEGVDFFCNSSSSSSLFSFLADERLGTFLLAAAFSETGKAGLAVPGEAAEADEPVLFVLSVLASDGDLVTSAAAPTFDGCIDAITFGLASTLVSEIEISLSHVTYKFYTI